MPTVCQVLDSSEDKPSIHQPILLENQNLSVLNSVYLDLVGYHHGGIGKLTRKMRLKTNKENFIQHVVVVRDNQMCLMLGYLKSEM
jgi:hypothetical protein